MARLTGIAQSRRHNTGGFNIGKTTVLRCVVLHHNAVFRTFIDLQHPRCVVNIKKRQWSFF
jgi:hypothetical protein